MLGLADLFVSGLLFVNGAAVLNEERFLVKVGWGYEQSRAAPQSVKKQVTLRTRRTQDCASALQVALRLELKTDPAHCCPAFRRAPLSAVHGSDPDRDRASTCST